MKNTSKIAVVVVLVLVVLFGVGQFFTSNISTPAPTNTQTQAATPSSTATNPPATQVIDYSAVTDPAAETTSTPIEKGSCFANSVAAPYRADAWRCTVGNAISDPCFELATSSGSSITDLVSVNELLCGANPSNPYSTSTFVLKLTKPLPKLTISTGTSPTNWAWLVELNDGTICSPFEGTRPFTAAGDVAIYACNSAVPGEDMIFGPLNNSSSVWTAEVGSLSTSTKIFPPVMVASATVPVATVWQ